MNAQTNLVTGRALLDALNAGDLSGWEAVLAEDYTAFYPSFRQGADRETTKAHNARMMAAMPDAHFDIQRTFADGDTVAYQWVVTGTHTGPLALPTGTVPATGRTAVVPGVLISTIKDGKIVQEEMYWNQVELLTQLGLMG
jgi:steroid delta-isomerase-like uncharacterized protein